MIIIKKNKISKKIFRTIGWQKSLQKDKKLIYFSTKKKYLAFLTSFETINGTIHVHKFLISKFLEKYDQIYFININNFLINKKNKYKFDEINLKDKDGILFNPKIFLNLINFVIKKSL